MIPTWDEMHKVILQQMDESEKTTGVRKTTQGALAKAFTTLRPQISLLLSGRYKKSFDSSGLIVSNGGGDGFRGGIYEKEFAIANSISISSPKKEYTSSVVRSEPRENQTTDNVRSLIDRLDAPIEKKSIETLLGEQIRLQLDRNAQFADQIFQIAMGA